MTTTTPPRSDATSDRLTEAIRNMPGEERARLAEMMAPRLTEAYIPHPPHPPQMAFLALSHISEVFYGGAAGGGKSDALLMAALQYADVPGYSALVLRRTFADLTLPGALMDRAWDWLGETDARPISGGRSWRFPSGARLTFGYIQHYRDVEQYRSAEFQFIAFDELTQFEERTYEFLFSRLRRPLVRCVSCGVRLRSKRSAVTGDGTGAWEHVPLDERPESEQARWACHAPMPPDDFKGAAPDGMTIADIPLRMRSASNPGGLGHTWVRDRFVDERRRRKDAVFVPALLEDNPSLDQESYANSLSHLGPVERARLLRGDWVVIDEGAMFQRHWFEVIPAERVPAKLQWVRYWDLAATAPKKPTDDPDWTVGCLMAQHDGVFYIKDVRRFRDTPNGVEKRVLRTAQEDDRNLASISIEMEQEPGASGVATIDHYRRHVLKGYAFRGRPSRKDKVERARPASSAAEAGNVMLVEGDWNHDFLEEVELFPHGAHDDQVDAMSGAMDVVAKGRGRLIA